MRSAEAEQNRGTDHYVAKRQAAVDIDGLWYALDSVGDRITTGMGLVA